MRYDEFLAHVRDSSNLADTDHAEQAVQATLDVLGQRLSGGETADLAEQLPEQLQQLINSHTGDAESFDVDEFLHRVADREARGCSTEEAREHAHAVLSTMTESVTTEERDNFRSQLPPGYDMLLQ